MSAFFRSTSPEKTVLVVDVENGSVATALVSLSPDGPVLLSQHRASLSVPQFVSGADVARRLQREIDASLRATAEVAARLRQQSETGPLAEAHLFFGAPWTQVDTTGRLRWEFDPHILSHTEEAAHSVVGDNPVMYHPFARAAAHTTSTFAAGRVLLCIITGEIIELFLVEHDTIIGRATIPVGTHTILRTITTHTGLSIPEAHSAFRLYHQTPDTMEHLHPPLASAAEYLIEQFADAAGDLLWSHPVRNIVIVGPEPIGEWFARTLSEHPTVARLFPDGGAVRALLSRHLMPHVETNLLHPDLAVLLEARFVHTNELRKINGIK